MERRFAHRREELEARATARREKYERDADAKARFIIKFREAEEYLASQGVPELRVVDRYARTVYPYRAIPIWGMHVFLGEILTGVTIHAGFSSFWHRIRSSDLVIHRGGEVKDYSIEDAIDRPTKRRPNSIAVVWHESLENTIEDEEADTWLLSGVEDALIRHKASGV